MSSWVKAPRSLPARLFYLPIRLTASPASYFLWQEYRRIRSPKELSRASDLWDSQRVLTGFTASRNYSRSNLPQDRNLSIRRAFKASPLSSGCRSSSGICWADYGLSACSPWASAGLRLELAGSCSPVSSATSDSSPPGSVSPDSMAQGTG